MYFNIAKLNCRTTEIQQEFYYFIILRLNVFTMYCKNKWILIAFKVTEVSLAEPMTLLKQQRGLCSALRWRHTSFQGTKILGKGSYACIARLSVAPELRWLFALTLLSGEVALIISQYAIKLLCKIPLNWGKRSCYLEETFIAEFGVVTQ